MPVEDFFLISLYLKFLFVVLKHFATVKAL